MKDKGFIVLYRDIFDWEWFEDAYVFKLFICLIMLANHEPKKYKGLTIERGTLTTSIEALSQKTKLSINSVKHSLKKLTSTGEITQEVKPNKYRIITIKNYDKYQAVGLSKTNRRTNSRTNNRTDSKTNNRTDNRTTNNNINNITNKTSVCASSAHTQEPPSAPRASDERGLAVSYGEMRQYQIDSRIGNAGIVTDFYNSFHNSKTKIPADWKSLYQKFAAADRMAQVEFIERLTRGEYRDKWGAADERA